MLINLVSLLFFLIFSLGERKKEIMTIQLQCCKLCNILRFITNFVENDVAASLVWIKIICLYKDGHHTVRNKGDLDSFIKIMALKSYLNHLYSDGIVTFFIPLTISKSVHIISPHEHKDQIEGKILRNIQNTGRYSK